MTNDFTIEEHINSIYRQLFMLIRRLVSLENPGAELRIPTHKSHNEL